jgi:uracil-DNA glycosylase
MLQLITVRTISLFEINLQMVTFLCWNDLKNKESTRQYFIQLQTFLNLEYSKKTIFPPKNKIYSFMHHCELPDVKVVILGQDPYHNVGQAHGLAFSVPSKIVAPPSLINIYKELETDITGFKKPNHGNLIGWAKQGVLLLNAVLTVEAHKANSHAGKGWERFTDVIIEEISKKGNVAFMLWGNYAIKKAAKVDTKKNLVLKAAHPSPLSASRGFFGCKHFSKANNYLNKCGSKEINWSDLDVDYS